MIYGDEVPAGGTLPVPKELQGKPEPIPAGPSAEDIMRQQVARRRAYQQLETNPIPTLDRGGDIGMRQLGSEYPVLPTPEGKGNNILENLQNFDQGGDVGAPADFSGPVFPNPKGVRPMLDTEIPPRETERISRGAKMNTDNAPLTNPKGDTSNPAKTQALPPDPEIVEAGQREMGTHPSQQPQPAQPAPEVKGTDAERKAIAVDKQQAMGSGNLVKLGTAILNERHLKPMTGEPKVYDDGGDVQVPEEKLVAPPELNQGYRKMTDAAPEHGVNAQGEGTGPAAQKPSGITAPPEMARPQMKQMLTPEGAQAEGTAAGQGMKPMRTEPAAPAAVAPAPAPAVDPQVAYKAKLAQYDTARQAALDEMTADGKERADRIAYAKQNFVQANPYGSAGNHPGIGGKLLHGLARGAEIAADIAAPGLTQAIPGTPERMARQQAATQGNIAQDTSLALSLIHI